MRTFFKKILLGVVRNTFLRRLVRYIGITIGMVWAFPLTVFGLLVALPTWFRHGKLHLIQAPTPALLASGPLADYLLQRHPFGPMCAMAIGHVVIAEKHSLTPQILTHELAHVRQAAQWGIIFPFAYLAASAWAALRGQDAYWHNVFEIAARKAENRSQA
jgi:hypothetical protein